MVLPLSTPPKIVAVVAAYNEAPRIKQVLGVLLSFPGFDEVIVVDDGSTDGTGDVAEAAGAKVIRLLKNGGKGQAMELGVNSSGADVIFFCDADVRRLTHNMIAETLSPVVAGELDMKIAMRGRKIYNLTVILRISPLLGGERAVSRRLWNSVPAEYKEGFKIETALNFYARHFGKDFTHVVFDDLSQIIKEQKRGVVRGFISRISMFTEVILTWIHLHLTKF